MRGSRRMKFVLFVILNCLQLPAARGSCADGWTPLNGKCLQVNRVAMSWQDARDHCLSLPGDLLSISSDVEEAAFVAFYLDTIGTLDRLWIGLNDIDSESNFVWSDGTNVTYTNWYGPNPDDWGGNEDCVDLEVNRVRWLDTNCNREFPFVCVATDLESTTQTTTQTTSEEVSGGCYWELQCKAQGRRKRSELGSTLKKVIHRNGGIVLVADE